MSKLAKLIIDAEERGEKDLHEAMDNWDREKLGQIVFHKEIRNGKECLVNTK